MKKALIALLFLMAGLIPAMAQNTTGMTVATCASPPVAFKPSTTTQTFPGPFTVDTTGSLCIQGTFSATITFPTIGDPVPATGIYNGIDVGGTLRGWSGLSTGSIFPGAVAIVDASGNQITSFGGSNASVSATGSSVPASATYAGINVGGNLTGMVGGHGTAASALRVELPTDGTGVIATVGAVTTITNAVTVSQATAASLNATVVGTGTFAVQAAQTGTWTVQPGNTANTTPWLTTISQGGNAATVSAGGALKVDASASTQPVSGTVTANQGGAPWTVTGTGTAGSAATGVLTVQGIASMTPLLANPGTAANWGVLAQGASTSGQLANLVMGAVTTSAPTYSDGQSSPLSLATTGSLRVVCTSGCAGGGSGGTSSVDEAAFTAGSDSLTLGGGFFQTTATDNALTNGQGGTFQLTANRALFTNLRDASGTEVGTSGAPLQVTLANTGANATAVKVNVASGGIASGAVASGAFASGALASGSVASGALVDLVAMQTPVAANTATATKGILLGGQYDSTQKTLTNGQQSAVSLSARGAVMVSNGAETFTVTVGAMPSNSSVNVAQVNGVTTSTGTGAVGTGTQRIAVGTDTATIAGSAPGTAGSASSNVITVQGVASMTPVQVSQATSSNLKAQVDPLTAASWGLGATGAAVPANAHYIAINSGGNLTGWNGAVTIASGGVASGAIASGAVASGAYASGSIASGAMVDITNLSTPITPTTATATKGILLGGQYNSTQATFTNGQQGALQVSSRGELKIVNMDAAGNARGANVDASNRLSVSVDNVASGAQVQTVPGTSGGLSAYTLNVAASDNHAVVKAGAGQVYSITAFNNNAAANYIRLYNATTGFNGCNSATNLQWSGIIPGATTGAGFVVPIPEGVAFATGISICVTGAFGNTDTTNAVTNTSVNVGYK